MRLGSPVPAAVAAAAAVIVPAALRPNRARVLAVSLVVSLALGAAPALAAPPKGAVTGRYLFTFTVTNAKLAPGKLVVRVLDPCRAPCTSFRTQEREVGATRDRGGDPRDWTWNGKAFVFHGRLRGGGSCVGTKKRESPRGYDIVTTFRIRPTKVEDGRVTRFAGTGRDDYVVNGKGRRIGCVPGAYLYDIRAVAET